MLVRVLSVAAACILTRVQLGRKMIHTAGEGDNVKNLAIVGGCSLIGLLCSVCVAIPFASFSSPAHITDCRELFNVFTNRKTAGR
jgi:hypothetical protein